ncbi:cytochrome P450 family protein [Pseudonocardia sp. GCM10023141]|uniref:cytochrome P450 family protein n=1 Tax=Pseudonocardia sp. GCM10023141 TaxID=3252653 RepID=UPI0036081EE9
MSTARRTDPSPFTEITGPARHAAFAELATTGPVQQVDLFTGVRAWVSTGYAETRALLAHPDVVKGGAPFLDAVSPEVAAAMNTHLLGANPPDHTRLRRLVSAAFTARRTEALAPRIQEITDALLDGLEAAGPGPVDLVAGFAYPLPITVIAELLGIPELRRDDFRRSSSIVTNGALHGLDAWGRAAIEMVGYVRELIAEKRAAPADDLLSDLIAVQDGGDRLSADELSSMVFLLLTAGHETTVNLICAGTHALLTHPDQLALLRAEPHRWPAAVNELLRFDGPLQVAIPWETAAPVRVGDVTIPAGDVIVTALLAANRDPVRYPDPDLLDITRDASSHLAFGHGIHHCIGAPLARLEGRIALSSLFGRFPELRLATGDEPTREVGLLMNKLVRLPVIVR